MDEPKGTGKKLEGLVMEENRDDQVGGDAPAGGEVGRRQRRQCRPAEQEDAATVRKNVCGGFDLKRKSKSDLS